MQQSTTTDIDKLETSYQNRVSQELSQESHRKKTIVKSLYNYRGRMLLLKKDLSNPAYFIQDSGLEDPTVLLQEDRPFMRASEDCLQKQLGLITNRTTVSQQQSSRRSSQTNTRSSQRTMQKP